MDCNPNPSNSQPNSISLHINFSIMPRTRLIANEYLGSETMIIEENPVFVVQGDEELGYELSYIEDDIEEPGYNIEENGDIEEDISDDLGYLKYCMFMNILFNKIFKRQSDQYISQIGSSIANWLCVTTTIFTILKLSTDFSSPRIIFIEIIILCLVIGSLQFSDMFSNRLATQTSGIETRIGGIETQMSGIKTQIGELETQIGGLETRMGGLETRMGGLETQMGEFKEQVKSGFETIIEIIQQQQQPQQYHEDREDLIEY